MTPSCQANGESYCFARIFCVAIGLLTLQRRTMAKIVPETRHHQVCKSLVIAFDVTVVSEIGNDDQSQSFGVRGKTFEGVNFTTKFESLLTAFDPVSFVQFTDNVEHLFAAQAIEIRVVGNEQLVIGQAGDPTNLRQQNIVSAVLDILQVGFELRAAMLLQFEPALDLAPGLVGSDIAAFGVSLRRPSAQVGQIAKRGGPLFERLFCASQIPLFAYPCGHAGAEPQTADEVIFEVVLLEQVKIFPAGGVAPTEEFEIGQTLFDQNLECFDAHAKGIDREPILQFFVSGNIADNELRSSFWNGGPRVSAVMSG